MTRLLMGLGLKELICITMPYSEGNNKIDLEITSNTISNMNRSMRSKAWHIHRAVVHFRLRESQPFRVMVCILVLNKKVRVFFSFPSCR